jgi:hypothetical protein
MYIASLPLEYLYASRVFAKKFASFLVIVIFKKLIDKHLESLDSLYVYGQV